MIAQTFNQMKQGQDLTKILPNATTKEFYFYIKAFKLANQNAFFAYCQQHKQANPAFLQMLRSILSDHYPPLEYCHPQEKGYEGLDTYVDIANEVFNDAQTTNPPN